MTSLCMSHPRGVSRRRPSIPSRRPASPWLTGIGLWWVLPPADQPNSWFMLKIGFVVLLTLCHGLARVTAARMARTGDQTLYPRLELLVSGVWLSALAAITLAVLAFET